MTQTFRKRTLAGDDGQTIVVYECGMSVGPAVLLVNALGMSVAMLAPIARRLCVRYRVIAVQSRGLPDISTWQSGSEVSVHRHARDIAEVMDANGASVDYVLAYCSGANIVGYALSNQMWRTSKECKVCIVSPSVVIERNRELSAYQRTVLPLWRKVAESGPGYAKLVRALLLQGAKVETQTDSFIADMERQTFSSDLAVWVYAQLQAACQDHDGGALMQGITAKALVLHGGADHLIHPGSARVVAEHMSSAEFEVISEAGHYGIYENEEMQRRIATFMKHG